VVLVGLHSCLTCSRGAAVEPFVRDCETERLFLCCVVRSRFDPFEVCPGVGTVVTAVVACGVPEWWHSFGYGVTVVERTSGVELVLLFPLTFRALVVAFLLPLLSGDVCIRTKCRALGDLLTSGLRRAGEALLGQGELLRGFSRRFEVLDMRGVYSRCEDIAWSGGNTERTPVFAFFAKVGCFYLV
ncbi:hypothetical protein Taro_007286, partial [Colocasia esculenta]|nr:hypothetical protein [Colocasia esculenta]